MSKRKRAPVISMGKAVELLRLRISGEDSELVPTDVSDINVLCPCCSGQHSSRRLTLNINFEENVFGCMRCNFNGGVYKLISHYTGWAYDEVETKVKAGELGNFTPAVAVDTFNDDGVSQQPKVLAPLKQRHEVYKEMLSMLQLYDQHKDDLLRRGLSEEAIEKIGFRSFPKYMNPTVIARRLTEAGLDLRGVPGFGINVSGIRSMASLPDGGYLVPMVNGSGYIQGFQVRFDHPSDSVPKYGYFTSGKMNGGAKCGTWCSWAGEDLDARANEDPFDVILIEGPLKAYIVHEVTGCNVIAVPGVAALKKVPAALQQMVQKGLRCVYIAYDMDAEENEAVAKQLGRLREILADLKIPARTLKWDKEFKGLDDWVTSCHFDEFR